MFLFSAYKIVTIKIIGYKEENHFEDLRDKINKVKIPLNNKKVKKSAKHNNDLSIIYKENHDLVAWIKIPGTPIDYPVMSTPNEPNFYLRHGFNKEYAISGTPYIGDGLSPESKSFIIYGHNMNNKTMFGSLENYKNYEYMKKHKYVELNTLNENRKYEVVAAFHTEVSNKNNGHFKYYSYSGNWSKDKFNEFFDRVNIMSIYRKVNTVSYEDQIMMLSTCSYFADNGRFILVTKRVN